MTENIKMILISSAGVVVFGLILYGCYWMAKTASYSIFYEEMVRGTIIEMVKPEYLLR